MLDWYDANARVMPWRIGPADRRAGTHPDPYRVWLSEVMLQQTTVATVRDYFHRFTTRWPDVGALAAAADGDVMGEWAGLGYYARARNLLKCARAVVNDHDGVFPDTTDGLLTLPGIGPYTAAAVAAIAFDRPAVVVDGNVERVVARLFDVATPLPGAKPELTALAARLTPAQRPGDHAQAMMDLGATICSPRNPACGICPLSQDCLARARGTAPDLPKKMPKKVKPTRHGVAYIARRPDGAWMLERRPDRGLLGGMLGWPGSDWVDVATPLPDHRPPFDGPWREISGEARHTFTHFHLRLSVFFTDVIPTKYRRNTDVASAALTPDKPAFVTPADFRPSDLPTVMRKAFDLAQSAVETGGDTAPNPVPRGHP